MKKWTSSEATFLLVWMSSLREKCVKIGTFQYPLEDREGVNYLRSQKAKYVWGWPQSDRLLSLHDSFVGKSSSQGSVAKVVFVVLLKLSSSKLQRFIFHLEYILGSMKGVGGKKGQTQRQGSLFCLHFRPVQWNVAGSWLS